ncbi:hypothetical protein JCM5350_006636 [Sporobolomyces pararoseus]
MEGVEDYPPSSLLTEEEEATLLGLASDYSLSTGLVLRPLSLSTTTSIHAPYSLYPSPFPKKLFEKAKSLQQSYNKLYSKITTDDEFLETVIGGNVIKVDDFTRKLYEIWKTVKREGIKQPISLGIFRSDYLVHSPPPSNGKEQSEPSLKQVEFNTISSSFGALSTKVSQLHRFLLQSNSYPSHRLLSPSNLSNLPLNPALEGISKSLVDAHLAYENHEHSSILMVIQDGERNAFDQRLLQWTVTEKYKIPLLRIPFSQLRSPALSLSPHNSALLYTPPLASKQPSSKQPIEISLVYYRTAYSPQDYYTPQEWSTRLLIEKSLAIKCPSIGMQLSGCKKIQQVLSQPSRLEKFVQDEKERKELRESFVGLWGMEDGGEGEELAMKESERFVLKPQREGGGNNIYRKDIPTFLSKLAKQDEKNRGEGEAKGKEGYILMELIQPPEKMNQYLVKAGENQGKLCDVVSELGIYGTVLLKENLERGGGGCELLKNEEVGHLLRTKGRESDEGGIAVGFSVLDSPLLV